jgi:hypothetical protein
MFILTRRSKKKYYSPGCLISRGVPVRGTVDTINRRDNPDGFELATPGGMKSVWAFYDVIAAS